MSVPRDRVSHGAHAFPFAGLRGPDGKLASLPCIPIRLRYGTREWSTPFDAVVDTGSTRTVIPFEWAEHLGIEPGKEAERLVGAGGSFETVAAVIDLSIVDAHYPQITCWEIAGASIRICTDAEDLSYPVHGWDVLGLFRTTFEPRQRWIELSLLGA